MLRVFPDREYYFLSFSLFFPGVLSQCGSHVIPLVLSISTMAVLPYSLILIIGRHYMGFVL